MHNAKDKESFTLENDKEVPSRDVEAEQQTSDREITEEDIKAIEALLKRYVSDKPYDSAFRALMVYCSELVIPLINHVFNETFSENAEIKVINNDYQKRENTGNYKPLITDSIIEIMEYGLVKRFHFECESNEGKPDILLRIMEYDFVYVNSDSYTERNDEEWILRAKFPKSCVIFLRSNHSTPDKMSIIFEFENGLKIKNGIKVLKVSDYSINDTLEKKLYFLVPFLSFNDEKLLKDNKDDLSVIEKKLELYCDLMDKLKEAYTKGELSDKCYRYLVELFLKVLVNLVKKCYSILKGVSKMDVEIYRIPEQDLIDEAEERGKAIGEAEGEAITLINNTKTIITSNIDRNQKVSMILGFLSNVSDRTEAIRRLRSNVSGFNDIMEGYKLV